MPGYATLRQVRPLCSSLEPVSSVYARLGEVRQFWPG